MLNYNRSHEIVPFVSVNAQFVCVFWNHSLLINPIEKCARTIFLDVDRFHVYFNFILFLDNLISSFVIVIR